MNFGQAIETLKEGKQIVRRTHFGTNVYLALQVPDEHSKMTQPYIYRIVPAAVGEMIARVPWSPSQADILAEDWSVVE